MRGAATLWRARGVRTEGLQASPLSEIILSQQGDIELISGSLKQELNDCYTGTPSKSTISRANIVNSIIEEKS